jgi:hypothetical protein
MAHFRFQLQLKLIASCVNAVFAHHRCAKRYRGRQHLLLSDD